MINGLTYCPNYITPVEESQFINLIDDQVWQSPFQRRVRHYGYVYDYRRRIVEESMYLGNLPEWLQRLSHRLEHEGFFKQSPDQVIINEYTPSQGITPHIDCEPCFEDTIVSISLGSQCIMDFYSIEEDTVLHQTLQKRSLICLQGEARYKWKHGIVARKSDVINGERLLRQRRISLTFRKVILVTQSKY